MLRLAAFLTLALAAVAAGCTISNNAPAGFSEVRVCGADAFSASDSGCKRDESVTALTSGRFYCSARLGAKKGETFHGRFLYRGVGFPESSDTLKGDSTHVWTYYYTGGTALPGGPWACELAAGTYHVRKEFSSGGPTGTVLDLAVCPTDQTTRIGPVRVCPPAKATTSLPPVSSLTCSATFAHSKGRTVQVEVVYRGKPRLHFERQVPSPVAVDGVQISRTGQNLPAGPYTCIFSLDGKEVARRAFQVAG